MRMHFTRLLSRFHIPITLLRFAKNISFVLLFAVAAHAQSYQLKNYNVKDGLPSSEVYAMMQDAQGYLWFTTDMGVSRFDGYSFKNFSTENGLADNTNFGILQDDKGRIWFYSFSGKISYFKNEKIHTLPCNAKLEKILHSMPVTSLFVDKGDTIWAGTRMDFILKITPGWEDKNVSLISLESKSAYLMYFDEKHFIYGHPNYGYFNIDVFDKNLLKQYNIPTNLSTPKDEFPRYSVVRLRDGSFISTCNNNIIRFNASGIILQSKINSIAICAMEEKSGNILIGAYDGVRQFHDNTFSQATSLLNLNKKIVTSICQDHENGLWFCTEGNGIFYIPFINFQYYTPQCGLPESEISCVTKAKDGIVCGHLDGTISLINGAHVQLRQFNSDTMASSRTNRTSSLYYDSSGILLVSSINETFAFNMSNFSLKWILPIGSKMLAPSHDKRVWSLQFRQLARFNPSSVPKNKIDVRFLFYSDNLYEDHLGKLWVSAAKGVWIYDSISGLVRQGNGNPLMDARIVEVREASDGSIWMATRGNGVIIQRGNQYFNITQKDGLAGNMCRTVFIDSANVVWVGTNNGLSKIQMLPGKEFNYSVKTFTSQNGLLTNEVNHILEIGNKLWLVHNNGISIFNPDDIQKNNSPPPVYITTTTINGDTLFSQQSLTVPYYQNYFDISFMGLSYKNPGHIVYKYKMEGLDSAWIFTPYTSVKYQTLPPGNYRFVVYAQNNDGYWSRRPATLSFTILPAWWQTWLFKIFAVIVLLLVIFFIFKIRLNVIREREEKKNLLQNRIAAIELNALRAQMNPHFVFNSINSVQYFITNNDPDSSQKYLSKFAKLIRYVVDNSKLTLIPVQMEIEALTLYLELEALRFGQHFEYHIRVHENVDTEYTQIPSMLIQPYVENAIWHGIMHKKGNGQIDVTLEMEGKILHCVVQDNGIGRQKSMELKREKDEQHKSVGMSNTRERLEIINQVNDSKMSVAVSDVLDEHGRICGTKVDLHIPIG